MRIPSLATVSRRQLINPFALLGIVVVGFLYLLFPLFLLNYRLVVHSLSDMSSLGNTVSLFVALFIGLFTAFSLLDSIILIVSALLVGINVVLLIQTLFLLQHHGRVRFSVGGATILGLISTGCSSCGFSILSLIGLSTSLSFLPFHGMELHILSVLLLITSSWYMLYQIREGLYCKINRT